MAMAMWLVVYTWEVGLVLDLVLCVAPQVEW